MTRRALIVGISQYNDKKLKNLGSFSNNAEEIARKLQKACNFDLVKRLPEIKGDKNFPAKVGKKTDVTKEQLITEIRKLFCPKKEKEQTTLALLYFTGHGKKRTLENNSENTYLVTSDADFKENWGLSLTELKDIFDQSKITEQVIWLDSCYAGELIQLEQKKPAPSNIKRFIIAAGNEKALEEIDGKHGVLTKALIDSLDPAKAPIYSSSIRASIDQLRKSNYPQLPVCYTSGGESINFIPPFISISTTRYTQLNQKLLRCLFGWFKFTSIFIPLISLFAIITSGLVGFTIHQSQKAKTSEQKAELGEIKALTASADAYLESDRSFNALVASIKGAKKVQSNSEKNCDTQNDICLTYQTLEVRIKENLLQLVGNVDQINRLEGHKNWIYAVDYCQELTDNRLKNAIASASADGTFKLWQAEAIEKNDPQSLVYEEISLEKLFPEKPLDGEWYYDISFFVKDCSKIATASKTGEINLWNWNESNQKLNNTSTVYHEGRVSSVSFSPDGSLLASASWDKRVKLWNIVSLSSQILKDTDISDGNITLTHKDDVLDVNFNSDGTKLATASADKTIKIWQLDNKEEDKFNVLNGHTDKVSSISFSPNGEKIASASWDTNIKLWEVTNSTLLKTLEDHTDRVVDISFIPKLLEKDQKVIFATASWDGTVKIWNYQGVLLRTLKGHTDRVLSVSFSKNGKTLVSSGADNQIIIWKINENWQPILQGHKGDVRRVEFSPDGDIIGTASGDKTVKFWNTKDGTLSYSTEQQEKEFYSISFSSQNTVAIAGEGDQIQIRKIDQKDQVIEKTDQKELTHKQELIFDVDFSEDGQWLASAGSNNTARLWKVDQKNQATPFCTLPEGSKNGHTDRVVDLEFLLGKNQIITASDDNTAKLWEFFPDDSGVEKCQHKKTLKFTEEQIGHSDEVNGVSFIADEKCEMIATASDDKTIKLWNLDGEVILSDEDQEKQEILGHKERIMSVEFSSMLGGEKKLGTVYLASASFDQTVKLWQIDCNSNQDIKMSLLRTFRGHEDWVWDASFNNDGTILASASRDETVRLWSLTDEKINPIENDLNTLIDQGCEQVKSYFKTNSKTEDPYICD